MRHLRKVALMKKTPQKHLLDLLRSMVALSMLFGVLGLANASAQVDTSDTTCPSAPIEQPFGDVDPASFAYNDIACLAELGIAKPNEAGYRPKHEVTREEMAAFMARTYQQLTGSPAEIVATPFTDVSAESFAADDIARIYGLGITGGTTPTTYSPKAAVIRSHMSLFLVSFYEAITGVAPPTVTTAFTDITRRPAEQQTAIGQIFGLGVTSGSTPTTFSPRAGVSREQMASFLARLYRQLSTAEPAAPREVTAEPSGEAGTELTVTWTTPTFRGGKPISGYIVQWKSANENYATTRQTNTRATTTTIENLTKGTNYTLRVAAVSAAGRGLWSTEVQAIPAQPPGLLTDFSVVPGNTKLQLTWAPPPDDGGSAITSFLIRWTSDRQATPLELSIEDPEVRAHTITGLRNATRTEPSAYYVWIAAVNAAGQGDLTPANGGVPISPNTVAPGLPAELVVNSSPTSGTELIAQWRAPLDDGGERVEHYRVERNCVTSAGTTGWVTSNIPGNPPGRVDAPQNPPQTYTLTIAGLENGKACDIRVRAVNAKSHTNGPWRWATARATPKRAPGPPTLVPTGVVAAHESLIVTWLPPTDTGGSTITGYEITYSSGTAQQLTVAGTVTSTTITQLSNGFPYTVSVRAMSGLGKGQSSAQVTATPKAVPAAPRNLRVSSPPAVDTAGNRLTVDPETLIVKWDAPVNNGTNVVQRYVVQYRESFVPRSSAATNDAIPAGEWTNLPPLTSTAISDRTVTITALKDRRNGNTSGRGVSFDVRVRALNDHDGDGPTLTSTPPQGGPWATTSATPATQPANVAADRTAAATNIQIEGGYRSLTLTWNPPDDGGSPISHYLLSYAEGTAGQFGAGIRVESPATRYTISGLKHETNYLVVVRAVNMIGSSEASHQLSASSSAVPSAPHTVTATVPRNNLDGTPGNGTELVVAWSAVTQANEGSPISGYEVQYRRLAVPDKPVPDSRYPANVWQTVDGDTESNGTDFPLAALSARVRGLENAASYEIRVRAVTRSGAKGASGYAPVVKTAGVPNNLSIVAVRINDAPPGEPASTKVVTWHTIGQGLNVATNYRIRWFPSEAGAPGMAGTVTVAANTDTNTYTITGLTSGTYAAKVSACNAIGCTLEVLSSADTSTQSGGTSTVP